LVNRPRKFNARFAHKSVNSSSKGNRGGIRRNFVVMRIPLALLLLLFFAGCASDTFTVTLVRTGGVSGITERYSVNQDGIGMKSVLLSMDSDSKPAMYSIDKQLAFRVHSLITGSLASFSAINMNDTGEMTTGLQIDARNTHKTITWLNVDPPKRVTPALDSLYRIMLRVEAEMIPPK
jgi:hypothetical protein